jgi:hypothetical protein
VVSEIFLPAYTIVHHPTEGATYVGARQAYTDDASDPHFTVTMPSSIKISILLELLSRFAILADRRKKNRASAVEIELVGYAGQPKNPQTLVKLARLCRSIEQTLGVPQKWQNGHPREPLNGQEPGMHNCDAANLASHRVTTDIRKRPKILIGIRATPRRKMSIVTSNG